MRASSWGVFFLSIGALLGYWLSVIDNSRWLIRSLIFGAVVALAAAVILEIKAWRSRPPGEQVWVGDVRGAIRRASFEFRIARTRGSLVVGEGSIGEGASDSGVTISGSIRGTQANLVLSPKNGDSTSIEELWTVTISDGSIVGTASARNSGVELGEVSGRIG